MILSASPSNPLTVIIIFTWKFVFLAWLWTAIMCRMYDFWSWLRVGHVDQKLWRAKKTCVSQIQRFRSNNGHSHIRIWHKGLCPPTLKIHNPTSMYYYFQFKCPLQWSQRDSTHSFLFFKQKKFKSERIEYSRKKRKLQNLYEQ